MSLSLVHEPSVPPVAQGRRWRLDLWPWVSLLLAYLLIAAVAYVAFFGLSFHGQSLVPGGHQLRHDAFLESGNPMAAADAPAWAHNRALNQGPANPPGTFGENIHFMLNLRNPIDWGRDVYRADVGFQDVYEGLLREYGDEGDYAIANAPLQLDYPPMRLLIVALWADWAANHHPLVNLRPNGRPDGRPEPLTVVDDDLAEKRTPWLRQYANDQAWLHRYAAWTYVEYPMVTSDMGEYRPRYQIYRGRLPFVTVADEYEFTKPMLLGNEACEAAGALAMFLLVRFWVRKCSGKIAEPGGFLSDMRASLLPQRPWVGLLPGLAGGLLLWFNPAVIWNGHCFPQWDVWLVPPFVLAIYLCLKEGWLTAGVLLGVAAMAKGQMLMVAPVLVIWPFVTLRWDCALKLVVGGLLGVAAVVSLWLVPDRTAAYWVCSVIAAMLVLLPLFFLVRSGDAEPFRWRYARRLIVCGIAWLAIGLLAWSYVGHSADIAIRCTILAATLTVVAARWVPVRAMPACVVAAASVVIWLCGAPVGWFAISLLLATALTVAAALFPQPAIPTGVLAIPVCVVGIGIPLALCCGQHVGPVAMGVLATAALIVAAAFLPWRIVPACAVGIGVPLALLSGVQDSAAMWAIWAMAVLVVAAGFLPWRFIPVWAASGVVAALAFCVPFFNGSTAWYTIGIAYGARHWKHLAWRFPTNLAGLLHSDFGWDWLVPGDATKEQVIDLTNFLPFLKSPCLVIWWYVMAGCFLTCAACWFIASRPGVRRQSHRMNYRSTIFLGLLVAVLPICLAWRDWKGRLAWSGVIDLGDYALWPIRFLLIAAYAISLVLCGIAIAVLHDRRDRRLLFAIATPWLLMFALLPQMQPRYLMFAAAFFSGAAAVGLDGLFVYIAVAAMAVLNMLRDQYMGVNASRSWPPDYYETIYYRASHTVQHWLSVEERIYPELGWGVLALSLFCLFLLWRFSSRHPASAVDTPSLPILSSRHEATAVFALTPTAAPACKLP